MNLIDDLLNQKDDPDERFSLLLQRDSSSSSYSSRPRQSQAGDEEINRIRQKAEEEKLESLKQFQELMSGMNQKKASTDWQDTSLTEEEKQKLEKARKAL